MFDWGKFRSVSQRRESFKLVQYQLFVIDILQFIFKGIRLHIFLTHWVFVVCCFFPTSPMQSHPVLPTETNPSEDNNNNNKHRLFPLILNNRAYFAILHSSLTLRFSRCHHLIQDWVWYVDWVMLLLSILLRSKMYEQGVELCWVKLSCILSADIRILNVFKFILLLHYRQHQQCH